MQTLSGSQDILTPKCRLRLPVSSVTRDNLPGMSWLSEGWFCSLAKEVAGQCMALNSTRTPGDKK